jgi:16S rRNA (uracil1498-N3)-methyltransferase
METPRFYHPMLQPGLVQLSRPEGHHFVSVLRGKTGHAVDLFDGHGGLAGGVVSRIKKSDVFVQIESVAKFPPRQTGRIILAVAAAKGQRFDWMLSKCTEIGVDHIALVSYERSVRFGRESAIERYQNVTIAACKQSGRIYLPTISGPHKLDEAIHALKQQYPQTRLLFGSLESNAKTVRTLIDNNEDVIVFIGPEGGLSAMELHLLNALGAIPIRIGSHILRTETAAAAFAAVLESLRVIPS